MNAPLRRALLCLLVAALAFLAHAPLSGSGFVGGDLDLLAEAAGRYGRYDGDGAWLARGEVRPIPAAVLRAFAGWHSGLSPVEPAVAAPYFAFALAVLLVAAAGAGVTLRRVLVPWLGESAARAAGWACAGLVVAHPVGVAAVARPIALGDLLALAGGTWCTAFFLRGRQQRRDRFLVLATLLAIASGFASSAAWILPFACACLEFASARRPRPFARKIAAASTVALVAAVAVAIESAFAWPQGFGLRAGTPARALAFRHADFAGTTGGFDAVAALKALGVLFVPAPSPGEAGAFLGCGLVLLLAAEPLLRAVRAAPRLWGWLALGWMSAIAVALALARELDVPAGHVELGAALMPSAVVVCAALATAATALGGSRRTVMPLAIAALLCILSDRTARIWPERSRELLELRRDLERGLTASGSGSVLVVGAPAETRLVPYFDDARGRFEVPGDLQLLAGPWPPPFTFDGGERLRRARAAAVPYVVRSPSFAADRRDGVAILALDRPGRPTFTIAPTSEDAKPFRWNDVDYGKLPADAEFDPIAMTMVRVTPHVGVSTSEAPRMRWRAKNPTVEQGTIEGVWVATDDGPQAIFDLGRSLDWLLGERIRAISFEGALSRFVTADILPRIDIPGVTSLDDHPPFRELQAALPRPWRGSLDWVVVTVTPQYGTIGEREKDSTDASERVHWDFTSTCGFGAPTSGVLEARSQGVTIARSAFFELN